jgi:CPA2 family monovalent cation:H+ antiporter-2
MRRDFITTGDLVCLLLYGCYRNRSHSSGFYCHNDCSIYHGLGFIQVKATNGYIIAGMIIGPYTPPFSLVVNLDVLDLFSEIGIILLLFVVGMEFPIEKLKSIGRKALVIALSEALGTFAAGIVIGLSVLHYSVYNSLFLGLAISVTSTVIVMRILEELDVIKEEASQLILGVAVIEDIVIISMLAILQSVVTSTGHLSVLELGLSIGTVLAFIVGVIIIGSKTIPKFVDYVARTNQHDLLIVTVLGVAFGLSFIAYEIGISVATGAFFAGVLIAESKVHSVTRVIATPIKDMFAAIFFVSVGALMNCSHSYIHNSCFSINISINSGKVLYCTFIVQTPRN